MRFLGLLATLLSISSVSAQSVFSDCSLLGTEVTQSEIDNTLEYFKQCIDFTDDQPYFFDGESQHHVYAANSIRIGSDFHAGPYENDGFMHLAIEPSTPDLDVEIVNYENLHSILRYKKLEFGVSLPDNIQNQIDNFLFNEGASDHELNPFLEWDVDIEMSFYHAGTGIFETVDGFYYREFSEDMSTFDWEEIETNLPFRIRYAPTQNGRWLAKLNVKIQGVLVMSSPFFAFNVIESGDPGYVYVHPNKKNLMRGNRMIFPVGQNFLSPEKYVWGYHNGTNPETGLPSTYDDELKPDEMHLAASPYAWNYYLEKVKSYFDQGGRYIRTIQDPKSSLIEFEKLGNYYDRLQYAWGHDKLLDLCEEYDALMTMTLMLQSPFMKFGDYYGYDWDWDHYGMDGVFYPSDPYPVYCYNNEPGVKQPHEMFLNEADMKHHEQRHRYYISRYGYSTKIYEFQLLSEPYHLDQIWNPDLSNEPYFYGSASEKEIIFTAIENYHNRISNYIKNNRKHWRQLIGADATLPAWKKDHGLLEHDASIYFDNIDLIGLNWYILTQDKYIIQEHFDPDDNNTFYSNENSFAKTVYDFHSATQKPIFISEGDHGEIPNGHTYFCSGDVGNTIDGMCFGFTGVGGYFHWTGKDVEQDNVWPITIRAQNHFNGDDVINTLSEGYGEWIQGRQNEYLWKATEKTESKEHQYYLSQNQERCVGYVRNLSYNIHTMRTNDDCIINFDGKDHPIDNLYSFDWNNGSPFRRLKIDGLKNNTDYMVDFYSTNNSYYNFGNYVSSYCANTSATGKLTLEFPFLDPWNTNSGPILWYVVKQFNCEGKSSSTEKRFEYDTEIENIKDNLILFPNPAINELNIIIDSDDWIEISKVSGEKVISQTVKSGANSIDITNLSSGFYFIKFVQKNTSLKFNKL